MIELFIDEQALEVDQNLDLRLNFSAANLKTLDSRKLTVNHTIKVPLSAANQRILGFPDQIHGAERFNQTVHKAKLCVDGATLLVGPVRVLQCESASKGTDSPSIAREFGTLGSSRVTGIQKGSATSRVSRVSGTSGWATLLLIAGQNDWIATAETKLMREIPIQHTVTLNEQQIVNSWSDQTNVLFRYLPVQRDRFDFNNAYGQPVPIRIFSFEDYHPFAHLRTLLDAIVGQANYTFVSKFFDSAFFKSLYISGCFPTRNIEILKNRMDFLAGRTSESALLAASPQGQLFTHPDRVGGYTLGNIVESTDKLDNLAFFNNGNRFTKIGNRVAFIPNQSEVIAFEYTLHFLADVTILSNEELGGFNSITLDDGQNYTYKIPNTYARYNTSTHFRGNFTLYSDHVTAGLKQVRLNIHYEANQGAPTEAYQILSAQVTTLSFTKYIQKITLEISTDNGTTFTPQTSGWTLYSTTEIAPAQKEIIVTLRSQPKHRISGEPIYFSDVIFSGAPAGAHLKLLKQTSLRPIFWAYPSIGSVLETPDLMAHENHQIELFQGLQHLFNLCFYTDPVGRRIFVEPRDQFLDPELLVDWSDKIDISQSVEVQDPGTDLSQTMTLLFQDGDGAVARWNEQYKKKFGRWRVSITNLLAKVGETLQYNPFFAPTMNRASLVPQAQSAQLMQVGDRLRGELPNDGDLNFPPKIVRYVGMAPLLSGECWQWPMRTTAGYPMAAFHFPGTGTPPANYNSTQCADKKTLLANGFSLCFEDRDGQKGLHQFYDREFETQNKSRIFSVYLYLRPADLEPFVLLNRLKGDFRARYKLILDGETIYARLLQITDYDPAGAASTRCTFLKEIN